MTSLEAILRQAAADLSDSHLGFALVGGLAVSARAEPRFTRDADLAVAVSSDTEAEALLHSLQGRYRIEVLVEQEAVGRMATVRLSLPSEAGAPVIDLLFASSGIELEIVAAAEPLELLRGFVMPVARTEHLLALKVLSRNDVTRPQDIADIRALMLVASPRELERARQALALIAARGFHRGRSLIAEFEALFSR